MRHRVQWFYCLEPVHNGAGQGLGEIDRPIVREVTNSFPYLQGTSIKGAYRAKAGGADWVAEVFGAEGLEGQGGALAVPDARLLLFPVASLKDVFGYVTCPMALRMFARRAKVVGAGSGILEHVNGVLGENTGGNPGMSLGGKALELEGHHYLHDRRWERKRSISLTRLGAALAAELPGVDTKQWQDFVKERLVLIPDGDFRDLVRDATEVQTAIKIDPQTGTSNEGLRTVEYLPAESVLYSVVGLTRGEGGLLDKYAACVEEAERTIQLGGDASTGKGLVLSRVVGGRA